MANRKAWAVLSGLCIFSGGALFGGSVDALADDSAFEYRVTLQHLESEPARMELQAQVALRDVEVTWLNCGKNKSTVQKRIGQMAAGSSETISWDQPRGVYHCSLVIRARNASGAPVSLQADHEFTSSAGIDLLVNLRELSPEVNDITLRATQPMVKAHVVVTADDGTRIDEVTRAVSPPSKEAKISWQKSSLQPALIDIRIEDAFGMWATGTVFYYQIPHTDIVFDTGKSVVRPDQAPYLQESLTEIKAVLGRYQHVAMDLYISGFTDTVGSMASNDKLSLDRARAIAQWFRANGVSIAVYYRGLGERVLAVQTPDETDNAQNRRATYVLSNSAPTDHTELQGGKWQKL